MRSFLIALILLCAASWPSIGAYWNRTVPDSERMLQLLALVTVVVIMRDNRPAFVRAPGYVGVAVVATALAGPRVPQLVQMLLSASCLVLLLWHFRISRHVGESGLIVLSLPVVSRLPLFLGYPMRIATGMLATPMLRMLHANVERQGTVFSIDGQLIVIDAPCSGTNMLWAATWLTLTAACVLKLSNRHTVLATGLAALMVVATNALRSTSLVILELRSTDVPSWIHAGTGVVCYLILASGMLFGLLRLAPTGAASTGTEVMSASRETATPGLSALSPQWLAYVLACGFSTVYPFTLTAQTPSTQHSHFPGWPAHFEGEPLTLVELLPYEVRYAQGFPGRIARFTDGSRQIMFQWIPAVDRSVHSAASCLQNAGYTITPGPIVVIADGHRWSSSIAERNGEAVRVRERIESADGQSWQDVSAWYWDGLLGNSRGPYWVTIVTQSAELE